VVSDGRAQIVFKNKKLMKIHGPMKDNFVVYTRHLIFLG